MNPTTADPSQPPPPLPPSQPPRSSFSCDRHPDEKFSGFCPECLCERLTTLDQSSSNNPSSSRRNSTSSAAAALKSLFSKPSTSAAPPPPPPPKPSRPSSTFFPELRRTKSFSASKNESLSLSTAAFEPQRKSCDVRVRNTLFSLEPACSQNPHSKGIADSFTSRPVLEFEEEEEREDPGNEQYSSGHRNEADVIDEITELPEPLVENAVTSEIVGEDILKPMKDHIDLDSQTKKPSGGGLAGSIFSRKWQKWRKKQKLKKQENGKTSAAMPAEKANSKQNREIQPEMTDYGFGRRSCDTDPRFSLDVGRISFDGPRYSLDEPRASWDGYLIGRSFPRMAPMVSVVEDAPVVHVTRTDTQIPVEEPPVMMNFSNEDETVPGGSAQTREYYLDSSSRRRKSLDRSSSIRKAAAAVVAEIDEPKTVSNAKVLPASDSFHRAKAMVGEKDSISYSNSLRDDCSETFELTSFKDNTSMVGIGNGNGNGERKNLKKPKKWAWNIFGFISRGRGGGSKDEDDDRYSRANGTEISFSESWQDLGRDNGDARGGLNRKLFRSNSSVSWRNASNNNGPFEAARKSNVEMNGHGKERRDDFVLGRNRSACYFPNRIDNGLLRFSLTPVRGSR
ncbi:protein OCTOPUS-like [Ipomoea triloba]|uniref:protein OCTOPUS-like n=1 Tax=Ipomoea triloba TaxID=35885 RepID=UPI00125DAF4E|nr:protein OCTOPUS-like [Ipomoea triloba]